MSALVNRFAICAICCLVLCFQSVFADDWPGWMGSERDGVYRETGIIERIPESGLDIQWRVPIAGGYAGPAVADGRVFVFDFVRQSGTPVNDPDARSELVGQERLTALDAKSGRQLWQHAYACNYRISYPAGPRCTPTVDGDRVYILGAEGDLRCLRTDNGDVLWARHLPDDFGAETPIWGFAAHPLVTDDLLYTMVGGTGQGVVAFDKLTGKVRWKALDTPAGYCPPSIIKAGGVQQLIVFHPAGIVALEPTSGKPYWDVPLKPDYEMSIARPMVEGDLMFASAIRNEAVLIKLDQQQPKAEVVWYGAPREAVHSANATPLFVDGVIYGTDCNEGCLVAVDSQDGARLWQTFEATKQENTRRLSHGTAFLTRLGDSDRYLIMSETGDLQMARLTATGYEDLGRFRVLAPTGECFGRQVVWSHPAYAGRTAFVRNDEEIVAVSLAQP